MPESTKRALAILTYAALALGVVAVYWQVRNFSFVNYDDNGYVYENQHVTDGLTWDGLVSAFTTAPVGGNWLPLTWLSLMLDCQLFGPRPGAMHLVNLLFHLANTLLLFAVLKKMTGALWQSAFVAAAFALHPMHVESVAWVTERKDVLSTFFVLLTVAAYVNYVRCGGAFRYVLTVLLFAAGLLAKPMIVTLPLLLLLLDYWPLGRFESHGERRNPYHLFVEKVPLLVLSGVFCVTTFLAQESGGSVSDLGILPLGGRVANALMSYWTYTGKMFWPRNLAVFYPFDAGSIQFGQAAIIALLMVAVTILAIRFGRKQKYLLTGWLWFVVALLPVIGLVQSGTQAMADRYTYIPYVGLFIMVAWGLPELLSKWPYRNAALGASAVVAVTVLGICAHRQVSYWANGITLFSHAIEVTQNNVTAYSNRGDAYTGSGHFREAADDFRQVIALKPNYYEAYYHLGNAYAGLGRGAEAIEAYRHAIRLKPDYAEAYQNLGAVLDVPGSRAEAMEAYGQAIRLKPDYATAYHNRGCSYRDQGRLQEAMADFLQTIRIDPLHAQAYNDLARLIATSPGIAGRDTDEAVHLASRACELTGYRNPVFVGTLAAAYASAGRFSEAVNAANAAMKLAEAANLPQLKSDLQKQLSSYMQSKPWVGE